MKQQFACRRDDNVNDVDHLPRDHKLVVHEFGYAIYRALIAAGVKSPSRMRQLVFEIWCGARGSTGLGKPKGFPGEQNLVRLDWLLVQSGSQISAATLVRLLRQQGLVILPMQPSPPMIEASLAAVTHDDPKMSKPVKHTRRLRAAIDAGIDHFWPFLKKAN